MPTSKKRNVSRSRQARETQAAQRKAEERKKLTLGQYRFRRGLGWTLVALAIAVGISHWLAHIGVWRFASPAMMDLTAGYPLAAALAIGGSIVLSKA
ncbi:MAG: hypothetical protein U0V56_06840 [Actinomycetota bacterium]